MNLHRNFMLVFASLLAASVIACGGSTAVETSSTQGSGGKGAGGKGAGGTGAGGSANVCKHDAPGKTFKLHLHNKGMRSLNLAYGCGAFPPFYIDTKNGKEPLSPAPESQVDNGFTCDAIFAGGKSPGVYSDCGPGYGAAFGPGTTVDLTWDRRSYEPFMVPAECSGHADNDDCFLGHAVAASSTQKAELTICKDGGMGTIGYCTSPEVVPVTFDTTGDEATLEIQ